MPNPESQRNPEHSQGFFTYLFKALSDKPERIVFSHRLNGGWQTTTGGQLLLQVNTFANQLISLGLQPGDRVGICLDSSPTWEALALAINRIGCSFVGLSPFDSERNLEHLLALAKPKIVIAGKANASLPCTILIDNLLTLPLGTGTLDYLNDTNEMCVLFTSGTTGSPKARSYRLDQWQLAIETLLGLFPNLKPGDRTVCWLPLSNPFQRLLNLAALAMGVEIHFVADPKAILTALPQIRPHLVIGVPRFFERVRDLTLQRIARWPVILRPIAQALAGYHIRRLFGGLRPFIICGSAPCPHSVLSFFDGIGLPIYEAYGVSECICPIAVNTPGFRKAGTVGKPIKLNELRISDSGEVTIHSPCVGAPYLGRYSTGDLGFLDSEGYLTLEGRIGDQIKLSTGRWINPMKVEAVLREHALFDHVVIVGKGRKCPIALVTLKSGARMTPLDRYHYLEKMRTTNRTLAKHEIPADILVLREPFTIENGLLTSNLKIKRLEVEVRHQPEIEKAYRALEHGR